MEKENENEVIAMKTIAVIRNFHMMKQIELADKAGISRNYMSQVESGERTPSLEVLQKICGALNMPISNLFLIEEWERGEAELEKIQPALTPKCQKILAALAAIKELD
ncbi:MAG: helix-turn-helix domain-containing protein [Candidatus Nanopelagicaceae bacterium]